MSPATLLKAGAIVPQMVLWLPDEEAAQWRFDVEAELERLAAA